MNLDEECADIAGDCGALAALCGVTMTLARSESYKQLRLAIAEMVQLADEMQEAIHTLDDTTDHLGEE